MPVGSDTRYFVMRIGDSATDCAPSQRTVVLFTGTVCMSAQVNPRLRAGPGRSYNQRGRLRPLVPVEELGTTVNTATPYKCHVRGVRISCATYPSLRLQFTILSLLSSFIAVSGYATNFEGWKRPRNLATGHWMLCRAAVLRLRRWRPRLEATRLTTNTQPPRQ